jgi:hypothetical protein
MSLLGMAGNEMGSSINEYLRTGTGDVVMLGLSKLPDDKLDPNEALAVHSQMMKMSKKKGEWPISLKLILAGHFVCSAHGR